MSDQDVSLAVRWSELGADVPARAKKSLDDLKRGADDAAPSVGDRMATAFQRLEAREPTMVLRRTRLAIEELAASAIGVQGPMGRLAASLTMLIPGGAMTLGAVAGFAAIGFEIKKIIEFTDELDKSLLKLGESFAIGPSKIMFRAAGLSKQVEELREPGFFATIRNTVADMFTPGGWSAKESGAAIGRGATLAGTQTAADLAQQEFLNAVHNERLKAEREEAKAVQDATFAVTKASLGFAPLKERLFDIETGIKLTAIALSGMQPAQMLRVMGLTSEARALERANLLAQERNTALVKAGFPSAVPMTPFELEAFQRSGRADVFRARGANFGGPSVGQTGIIPPGMESVILGQGGIFGNLGASGKDLPEILRGHQGEVHTGESVAKELADAQRAHTVATRTLETSIHGLIAVILGASRGGVSGGLTAVGGTLTALSALGKAGAQGLEGALPALGPVGTVISAVGALASLFHGSGPKSKVIITAFEEQAREDIQKIRGDPATTSFVILGPDGQATAYSLARLASRGVIPRFPGSR